MRFAASCSMVSKGKARNSIINISSSRLKIKDSSKLNFIFKYAKPQCNQKGSIDSNISLFSPLPLLTFIIQHLILLCQGKKIGAAYGFFVTQMQDSGSMNLQLLCHHGHDGYKLQRHKPQQLKQHFEPHLAQLQCQ